MKKQPQITEQTKDKLRSAFWTLYSSKPIDKITIKEITDLAGYNRGTFYLYYKDVYDIFASIETELLQASEQILETARESELSGLKNHMSMIMALARKYSAYVSVLLRDPSSNQFPVQNRRKAFWRNFTSAVCLPQYQAGSKRRSRFPLISLSALCYPMCCHSARKLEYSVLQAIRNVCRKHRYFDFAHTE